MMSAPYSQTRLTIRSTRNDSTRIAYGAIASTVQMIDERMIDTYGVTTPFASTLDVDTNVGSIFRRGSLTIDTAHTSRASGNTAAAYCPKHETMAVTTMRLPANGETSNAARIIMPELHSLCRGTTMYIIAVVGAYVRNPSRMAPVRPRT
eukprot:Amastigsp_a3404_5.p4 type:complete len:150 gc:universal Amastigsp_a3404_5:487-38(-)